MRCGIFSQLWLLSDNDGILFQNSFLDRNHINYTFYTINQFCNVNVQTCLLIISKLNHRFQINQFTGELSVASSAGEFLDRELIHTYSLAVIANDTGGLQAIAKIEIILEDMNDNYPLFSQISLIIPELKVLI